MKRTVTAWWPLLVILGIWGVFSSPYFFKGLVPFPSRYLVTFFTPWAATHGMPVKNNAMPDVITQIYPWKRLTIESWKRGEVPLWNPYSFSGTPHAGNYQTAVFSPVNLLFFVLPEADAWSMMIILQPLLAGLFMYMFLRSLPLGHPESVLGAVAYMFSGFMVVWMAYGTLGYAILFLPLVFYAIHTYLLTGSVRRLGVLSLGIAVSFLSGHFQMSLYLVAAAAAYAVFRLWRVPWKRRVHVAVFFILGLVMAAPQTYVSFLSFLGSGRSQGIMKGEIIPWQYLVTLFAPDFYGNPVTRNDWFGHYAEWAGFIGVVPLFLAVTSLTGRKRPGGVWFFGVAALGSLLLATPNMVNDLLYTFRVPVLSASSAARIIAVVSFSLCVLAAYGFKAILEAWGRKRIRDLAPGIVASLVGLAAVWVVLGVARPLQADKLMIAVRNSIIPSGILVVALGCAVAGVILPKARALLVAVFILLTAGDVLRFAVKWMPFDERRYMYPATAVVDKLQEAARQTHGRVYGNIGNEVGSSFGIPLIDGYDALYNKRYGELISSVSNGTPYDQGRSVVTFDKHGLYTEKMLGLLGVRYYMHKKSDGRLPWAYPYWEYPNWSRIWEDEHFEILENSQSLDRVFLVDSYVVLNSNQEMLDALYHSGFDTGRTVILEAEPEIPPQPGEGRAEIAHATPNSLTVTTESDAPKIMVLSNTFDPGWQVRIDGRSVPLYRADFSFQAVSVPAGSHTVHLAYWPSFMTPVLWISGAAALYCIYVLVRPSGVVLLPEKAKHTDS